MTNNQQIAETILRQLGGNRIKVMIGAKYFLAIESGLQFKWSAKSKNKANCINITLNGKDLYDVCFMYVRGTQISMRSVLTDVYAEDLISLFERETGLYLHF